MTGQQSLVNGRPSSIIEKIATRSSNDRWPMPIDKMVRTVWQDQMGCRFQHGDIPLGKSGLWSSTN